MRCPHCDGHIPLDTMRAQHNGDPMSAEAAGPPGKHGSKGFQVLEWFVLNGPDTAGNCAEALDMVPNAVASRLQTLRAHKLIKKLDRVGVTPTGHQAWMQDATRAGYLYYAEESPES